MDTHTWQEWADILEIDLLYPDRVAEAVEGWGPLTMREFKIVITLSVPSAKKQYPGRKVSA